MFAGFVVVVVLAVLFLLSGSKSKIVSKIAFGFFALIHFIGAAAFYLAIAAFIFGGLAVLWDHFFK